MNFRIASAAAAAACAALLGYAYYLQYVVGLNPCPLCLVQRGFFYAVMAAFAVAALHPHRVYPALAALFALGGIAASTEVARIASKKPRCTRQSGQGSSPCRCCR